MVIFVRVGMKCANLIKIILPRLFTQTHNQAEEALTAVIYDRAREALLLHASKLEEVDPGGFSFPHPRKRKPR